MKVIYLVLVYVYNNLEKIGKVFCFFRFIFLFFIDVIISYELVINMIFNVMLGKKDLEKYNIICIKYGKIVRVNCIYVDVN